MPILNIDQNHPEVIKAQKRLKWEAVLDAYEEGGEAAFKKKWAEVYGTDAPAERKTAEPPVG